jgi:hypothetical protein
MIITTPLDLPLVQPNDWESWWNVWHGHKQLAVKTKKNHNTTQSNWLGLDLYKKPGTVTNYEAPLAPQEPVVVDLCEQVLSWPIDITCIRVLENLEPIRLHSDHAFEYHSIRSMLWSDYPEHTWYLEHNDTKRNIRMPAETNTFYYLDGPVKHASRFKQGHTKGLLVVFGKFRDSMIDLVQSSAIKYKDYAWII